MSKRFVIGTDFATDSVRSVVVDADSGKTPVWDVQDDPRWKVCNAIKHQLCQHRLDYVEKPGKIHSRNHLDFSHRTSMEDP